MCGYCLVLIPITRLGKILVLLDMREIAHNFYPWLTKELLAKVLKASENNDKVQVIDYQMHDAVGKGENYTSHMIRVSVNFKCSDVDQVKYNYMFPALQYHENVHVTILYIHCRHKSFVVKTTLAPESNDKFEKVAFFKKEITFYSDILPRSVKYLNAVDKNYTFTARCFEVNENPTYFVFEDLKEKGYRTMDRRTGLNFKASAMVLEKVAKYHAISAMICSEQPESCDVFKIKLVDPDATGMMNVFLSGIRDCQELSPSWLGYEHLSSKLAKLSKIFINKIQLGFERDESEFNVITHGDLWVTNLMYKFDEDDNPIDVITVDFQLAYFGSPAIDLAYFLFTSTSNEIKEAEWDRLIAIYHEELVKSLKAVKYPKRIPSLTDIHIHMLKRSLFAVMMSFLILMLRHIDNTEYADLDLFASENTKKMRHALYDKPELKERVLYLLDYFERKGFLECY